MKRLTYASICVAAALAWGGCTVSEADDLDLLYYCPATIWEETLPLGNGRLGMMPDGGVASERIVLNEESMWSGSEHDTRNPDALAALPEIRRLLLEGRNLEAQKLMYDRFTCTRGSDHPSYGSYQLLGFLDLTFDGVDTTDVTDYRRGLSLRDAVAYTRFRSGKNMFERRYFVSRTRDAAFVELTTDRPGGIDVSIGLSRPERAEVIADGNTLSMQGVLDSGDPEIAGVGYMARAIVTAAGGAVSDSAGYIRVRGADRVQICLTAATSYGGGDYLAEVDSLLNASVERPFDELLAENRAAHRRLFDRVSLRIGSDSGKCGESTPERLARFADDGDPALAALYFQYGRYLFVASTREQGLPPNLQGIWANTVQTPWNGDYHLNINVEMNHWIAGVGNLDELRKPLFEYTRRMVPSGQETARAFYGTEGWCAHVLANAWNFTAPSENPAWGATNTGGAWLALDLWDRYLFNRDTTFLREAYPVMSGAADFFLANLVEEPTHGWLVTAPTSSPENGFYLDGSDRPVYVCMGSTMDNQIVRSLLCAVADAAGVLGCDSLRAAELRRTALRLPPDRIADGGYLMEWLEDYRETDVHHRHVSHLFGLYPGTEITPRHTPRLADACRAALERRGDEGTGWSRAWKICFWARLGDGDRALRLLKSLLTPAVAADGSHRSGTYPNLLCAHPPFQIDGNFGGAAGIAEMLLQSHDGCIELLPALPTAWPEGEFRGLMARGGVEVGCLWTEGRVISCTLRSQKGGDVCLRLPGSDAPQTVCLEAGKTVEFRYR